MANIKSNIKSIRQSAKRGERNTQVRSRIKTLAKKVATLAKGTDAAATKDAASEYIALLDKAAKRGIIHHNKASRHKSQMAKHVAAA